MKNKPRKVRVSWTIDESVVSIIEAICSQTMAKESAIANRILRDRLLRNPKRLFGAQVEKAK